MSLLLWWINNTDWIINSTCCVSRSIQTLFFSGKSERFVKHLDANSTRCTDCRHFTHVTRNHQVKVRKTSLAFKIPVSVSTNEVPSYIQPGFTLTHVETWPWTLVFCSATFSLRPNIKSQVMNIKYEHDMKLFCQYGITANILSQHLLWTFTTSLLTKPISGLSPKTKSPNSRSNRKPSTRVLAERT